MLCLLKHDLTLGIGVSLLTLIIHWGAFSGAMAATVAGLLMSLATSGLKRLFDFIDRGINYIGRVRLNVE
jgi:hypothetical protein